MRAVASRSSSSQRAAARRARRPGGERDGQLPVELVVVDDERRALRRGQRAHAGELVEVDEVVAL